MYLYSLKIRGFRKIAYAEIIFSPNTTFLIGANNVGKSSVFAALELFLSAKDKTEADNFYKKSNDALADDYIELIGEFRGVNPAIIKDPNWKGFNARRVLPIKNDAGDIIDYKFTYKRIFHRSMEKGEFYMLGVHANPKAQFLGGTVITWQDLVNSGIPRDKVLASDENLIKKLPKNLLELMEDVDEFWDCVPGDEEWQQNPGGISANVITRLPQLLLIEPYDKMEEYGEKKGALVNILSELFHESTVDSKNYAIAKRALMELENEIGPNNPGSGIQQMVAELNSTVSAIFPGASITASASLSCDDVLLPQYKIELGSNIQTKVSYQGTGQIRSAVLALLQYKAERDRKLGKVNKDLIIAFEEPELYLHPHIAYLMKEVIYKLSLHNQMVCSTHSPYMIDLSKDKSQVLNKLYIDRYEEAEVTRSKAFNVLPDYAALVEDEKNYIKMLLKLDAEVAKIFFGKRILIVEGDTEEIVLKQIINLLEEPQKNKIMADWTILKARGKPVIISVIKYLHALGFDDIKVMHDADVGKPNAEKFNEHIRCELNKDANLFVLENCIEDVLGYKAETTDKPFKAYKQTMNWKTYNDIPEGFRNICNRIFEL